MGAQVTLMDVNLDRLRYLAEVMPPNVTTLMSNPYNIAKRVQYADLVVGAVLVVGAKAPKLITRKMVKTMKKGAVNVDVANWVAVVARPLGDNAASRAIPATGVGVSPRNSLRSRRST
jgi:alanine dehydrogenase